MGDGGERLPARRLVDAEVADILRRASIRETRPDLPSAHAPTLGDLMAAAAEVGLDPNEVRRAASVVPARRGGVADVVFGAADRRVCTARLAGVPLPEAREGLASVAERHLGGGGQALESMPDRFVWQETHLGGRTVVDIAQVDGDARIEVRTDRAGHYLGTWFVGLLGWAALSALMPISLGLLPAVLAFLAAPPLLVRPFWIRADRRLRARMETLIMDLARLLEEGDPGASGDGRAGAVRDI